MKKDALKADLTCTLEDYAHREFRSDEFWRVIPAWKDVTLAEFSDHMWQMKHSIKKYTHHQHSKIVLHNLYTVTI